MIEQASLVLGNGNWAVKSDSLLGYKTIDGEYYPREFTFTRATTGTRVNEAGLVELVPYNLLRYSEEFDNAVWSKTSVTVTVNATTSPSGVLTADKLIPSGLDSYVRYMSFNGTAGSVYTFSFYAKADVITNIRIRQFNATELNGTVEYITINNQWQRFTVTSTCAVNQQVQLWIGGSSTWSTGEDIYVWGAQLVEGTEPLDYLPTTDRLDIARIDYSTGEPALLLEPQRTNLLTYSSSFDNGDWTKTGVTISSNATTSPDGTTSADKIIANASGGDKFAFQLRTITLSQAFTISAFFKKSEYKLAFVRAGGQTGSPYVIYNLDTEAVVSTFGASSTKIEDYGNGWYRILFTLNSATSTVCAPNVSFIPDSGYTLSGVNIPQYTGDGTSGGFVWGCQLEANGGSYSTSYIPTTSASVTRNQDVCVKTGASALIGQTEGTIYMEIMNDGNDSVKVPIRISNSLGQTEFDIGFNQLYQFRFDLYNAGVFVANIMGTPAAPLGLNKLAIAYQSGNYALSLNGSLLTNNNISKTYTSLLDRLTIGLAGNNFINQATLFKTRLSNSELQQLTTL